MTYCHVCKKSTFSVLVGFPPNLLTACGDCLSLSRQRLVARYLASINIDQLKVLHFAPEPGLASMFRSTKGSQYEPVDMRIESYQNAREIDIENIDRPDESYDVVIANHILEHVDDHRAIKELHRILRNGGVALATFPIVYAWEKTYEDPSIVDSEERELHFGQHDHLRIYGRDVEKIMSKYFEVDKIVADGPDHVLFGMTRGEILFILKKPLVSTQ